MRAPLVLLVVIVIAAGCAAPGGHSTGPAPPSLDPPTVDPTSDGNGVTVPRTNSTTNPFPTASPSPTPTPESEVDFVSPGTACSDFIWISFHRLPVVTNWASDSVSVGYYVPSNTSMLLVAYVDGTVRGEEYVDNSEESGWTVDGHPIELNASFAGEHVVEVVVYEDDDGSGTFDRGIDRPCLDDRSVLRAGPERVDFGQFD